jgi:type I restriction enzyme S subunit
LAVDASGLPSLPNGWEWTTLGEITDTTRKRADPQGHPELPFIGMEHLEAHTMRLLGTVSAGDMRSAAESFKAGDVIYGRLRPYLNKVYAPDFEGLCSAEFIVFREVCHLDHKYVQYFLNSWDFVRFSSHLNEGDRPRVSFDQLAPYPFPLAPLAEQRRIVEEIETQFSRLEAGVAALKRVQANLRRYRAAVLHAACEGRLVPTEAELARAEGRDYETGEALLRRILAERRARWEAEYLEKEREKRGEPGWEPPDEKWKGKYQEPAGPDTSELSELPEGWVWVSLEQVAAHEPNAITDGPFGSNLKTEHYTDSGPRVIRLQNIGDGEFHDERAHISLAHFQKLRKHQVFAGDLVIAALGAKLPRACIIPELVGPAIVKADCIRFKPHQEVAHNQYLQAALNSEVLRQITQRIIHGVGRPRLNQQEIRSLPVPLPPFSEQNRIAAEVERRLSVLGELEKEVEAGLRRAERLRQAILRRAFEGRLVPQDPGDEPASVLLERTRAGRSVKKLVSENARQMPLPMR